MAVMKRMSPLLSLRDIHRPPERIPICCGVTINMVPKEGGRKGSGYGLIRSAYLVPEISD